jgi:hypothetical protein
MPVTKAQAQRANRFHFAPVETNKEGEPTGKVERWRRNGATKVWVRSPERFQAPIKYGLRDYSYLTQDNAHLFHTEEDCPHGLT